MADVLKHGYEIKNAQVDPERFCLIDKIVRTHYPIPQIFTA